MHRKRRVRRSFFLAEIVMSFSLLVCTMIPCLRFYKSMERHLEQKLLETQLPAVVDTTFFFIHQDLQEILLAGDLLGTTDIVDRESIGEYRPRIYTSSGRPLDVSYRYYAKVQKSYKSASGGAKLFLVDVSLEVPHPVNDRVEAQRLLCVIY